MTVNRSDAQHNKNKGNSTSWLESFRTKLRIYDIISIIFSVGVAYLFRFTSESNNYLSVQGLDLHYSIVAEILAFFWIISIAVFNLDNPKNLGYGLEEYRGIFYSTITVFGVLALLAIDLKIEFARAFVGVALPLGLFLMLLNHWAWRKWLHRQRQKDQCMTDIVLVGFLDDTYEIIKRLHNTPSLGYRIKGVFLIDKSDSVHEVVDGVPVLGDEKDIIATIEHMGIGSVIVTSHGPGISEYIKQLAWDLEQVHCASSLIVSSQLFGFSGTRTTLHQVEGLPLVHLDLPEFGGPKAFVKRMVDIVGSFIALLICVPIFLITAVFIKSEDHGPILFNQKRVGLKGKSYTIYKLRSMKVNSASLIGKETKSNSPAAHELKAQDDPRVTKVGGFIRKYSIDEIPQFYNVFKGDMSLVGPRPLAVNEVDTRENYMHRRLYVRPGITGLWQISGRSNTTWEERVDMDFNYVEHWSLVGDILIILKTIKVVISGKDAY